MRKLNIYTIGKKSLVWSGNVRNVYDSSFYHKPMPTLSAKRCKEILNGYDCGLYVLEWADNGYTGNQTIYSNGTILNF